MEIRYDLSIVQKIKMNSNEKYDFLFPRHAYFMQNGN